jgi:cytochrome c oxidase subunit III
MSDPNVMYQIPDSGPPISRARLATVLWLVVESMVFVSLLGLFVIAKKTNPTWPPPYEVGGVVVQPPRVHLATPVVNAGILISAFILALRAQIAARQGDARRCRARLVTTAILGALFCLFVVYEFVAEAGRGVTISSGTYGTYWVSITAAHALHVLAGVIWLVVVLRGRLALPAGGIDHEGVEHLGLYWGFVTVMWVLLLVLLHFL